ncbi:sigma-E factor negative regulatory protein [Lacimicrobium alkaliphilum]|uniref:Anti-sigma-E factor RseA n=1 Tax=Lacimicrobium alkaliphilum TaxID=1526571 RepID=A0ABQ1RGQ6_9ALTE|nr:RseA family anti-sigma factor [Lacimicrobium alkaliphilum]GGD67605.1 anti-sigma-E factor RseA [Lacimicrobium alkaliphilum]
MTDKKFEDLSAWMDGESSTGMIGETCNDKELSAKWRNYHLIRDGMRKELPAQLNFDISASVARAIENEPAILAPKKGLRDIPVIGSVVPLIRHSGQFAIAASVAAAMIIGVQQLNQPKPDQPFSSAPALQLPGMQAGGLSPVSLEQTRSLPRTDGIEQKRRISAYLNDHQRQMRLKAQKVERTGENKTDEEANQK